MADREKVTKMGPVGALSQLPRNAALHAMSPTTPDMQLSFGLCKPSPWVKECMGVPSSIPKIGKAKSEFNSSSREGGEDKSRPPTGVAWKGIWLAGGMAGLEYADMSRVKLFKAVGG